MTGCSECLDAMATARIDDVKRGTLIALHCSTCYSCATVLEEVRFGEHRLWQSLSELEPAQSSRSVARAALIGSERKRRLRIARWLRGVLACVGLAVLAIAIELRSNDGGVPAPTTMTETIRLNCITAGQAAELATPYLRSEGSAIYRADELRTITLSGPIDELLAARAVIRASEQQGICTVNPSAGVPADVAPPAATSVGK